MTAAFGWAEQNQLQGVVIELLDAPAPIARPVGLAACGWHRVNPGLRIPRGSEDGRGSPCASASYGRGDRLAGDGGRLRDCGRGPQRVVQILGRLAGCAVGDRDVALEAVADLGSASDGMFQARTFGLAVEALNVSTGCDYVASAAPEPRHCVDRVRWIRGPIIRFPRGFPAAHRQTDRFEGDLLKVIGNAHSAYRGRFAPRDSN
jgi:hypothetical protein